MHRVKSDLVCYGLSPRSLGRDRRNDEFVRYAGLILGPSGDATVGLAGPEPDTGGAITLRIDSGFPDRLAGFLTDMGTKGEEIGISLEVLGVPINNFPGSLDFFKGIAQFGVVGAGISNDKQKIFMHDIPNEMKGFAHGQREARLVFPGMARAFAAFFDKDDGSLADIAVMLSRICSAHGTYRYCRSVGLVQSAGDVAVFLQAGPLRPKSFVVSADDLYGMLSSSSTPADVDRGEVFLDYELAKTNYPYLTKPNDLKMGLLHVCKEYAIRLCCGELVDDGIYKYMMGNSMQDEIPREFFVWCP